MFVTIVVLQEKVHQNLLNGVEHFDKATMKHAETQEKNILPDPQGKAAFSLSKKRLERPLTNL